MNDPGSNNSIAPLRAVAHPAFVVAVTVLIVNDHVLKHSALAGDLTGKLSDFAGLFFAPVLLAALLGVRTRKGLWLSAGAVGAVFSAINVSPALAASWDRLASLFVPWATTVDPTDLVALVAIPVGLFVLQPVMSRASSFGVRRLVEYALVALAGLASLATSAPCTEDNGCIQPVEQNAQVSILNKTNELHVLRVRYPRVDVQIDCDVVAEDPNLYLHDAIFGPPQTWFVQSGQEIPVQPVATNEWGEVVWVEPGPCSAALIETDTAPDVLVFWDSDLPMKSFPFDAEIPPEIPADPQTVVLEADYSGAEQLHDWRERSSCGERADLCDQELLAPLAEVPEGARYFWRSRFDTDLHFERAPNEGGTIPNIPDRCEMPGAGDGLTWEDPRQATDQRVVELEQGMDGCHQLLLRRELEADEEVEPDSWWLCVPFEAIAWLAPAEDGSMSRIAISEIQQQSTTFEGGWEGLRIDVTQLGPDGEIIDDRRIYAVRGFGIPSEVDFGFGVEPREGCAPVEAECGQVAIPVDVTLSQYSDTIAPGESKTFGEVVPVEVHVVRAEYRPVRDPSCENSDGLRFFPSATEGLVGYMEAIIISN